MYYVQHLLQVKVYRGFPSSYNLCCIFTTNSTSLKKH